MNYLITLTVFVILFIVWPRDLKSEMVVEPYFRDIDIVLIWVLAIAWALMAFYKFIKTFKER